MSNDEIRLKLVDPKYRSYLNWLAFERIVGMKKAHLKNILHQYPYCVFTQEENDKFNEYFRFLSEHLKKENLKELLMEPTVRSVLNWTGIENGLEIKKWTLKIVLLQYPNRPFSEEDENKLKTLLNSLSVHFSEINP
jgi:hypothetical protein